MASSSPKAGAVGHRTLVGTVEVHGQRVEVDLDEAVLQTSQSTADSVIDRDRVRCSTHISFSYGGLEDY